MARGANWTWNETLMAWALYMTLPGKELDDRKPEVQKLAQAIGRTPNSVSLKVWNIAAHDAHRRAEGKVGMSHGSRLDGQVWEAFGQEGDSLVEQAVGLLYEHGIDLLETNIEAGGDTAGADYAAMSFPEGKTREAVTTVRINQQYFRNTLIENYGGRCCITGLREGELLVASHIKPWSESTPAERLAPDNGLLLNGLHDRAFDKGLITLDKDLRVVVSPRVPKSGDAENALLWSYEGREIARPSIYAPRREFVEYHNDVIFQR